MSTNVQLLDVEFRILVKQLAMCNAEGEETGYTITVKEHQQRKLFIDLNSGQQEWTDWFAIQEVLESETTEEDTEPV